MNLQNETKIFIGIIIFSLLVAIVASAQEGQIVGIKAKERSETECYIQPNNPEQICSEVSVIYLLKIQGASTDTYTVRQEQRSAYVTYTLTDTIGQINDAKVNGIRQTAYDEWGYLMPKTSVIYYDYSKGQ